jgi:pimeloyl-ACP methyl ester carboxylesterase
MMQLVRVMHAGVDADGDGVADLDASRIYYVGHSNGANNGTPLVATEPGIRAAVLNAAGGLAGERLRLSLGNRSEIGQLLALRQPSLINLPDPSGIAFNENLPLRNQAPVINTVPGAMEIQEVLERFEWIYMPADAAAFAPFLRKTPLASGSGTPVIVQLAKGDTTVPNPATTAIIRAGDLADRTTYYRTDIAVERFGAGPPAPPPTPPPGVEKNGHNFLIRMNSPTRIEIALTAQEQVAVFFESDGARTIDPDGECFPDLPGKPGCLFEVPLEGPLPEDLGFIP